ncbi:MAG: ATP-binding cassette domain-containing protein [Pseudomonadota bacterium]
MLEALGITVRRGGRVILDDVDLRLAPGEIVAVIGPNGAGKSTALACLSGAIVPDAGTVRIDGVEPRTLLAADLALRRAVVDQTPSASAAFTVRTLAGLAIPRAVSPKEARAIEMRVLAATGLSALAARPLDRLSGGERQRAHVARALAQLFAGRQLGGGGWLLLDEPTAGLDLAHQDAVARAARAAADAGAGVLVVLHDLTLAAAVADRILLLDQGRVVADGAPQETLSPERVEAVYGLPVVVDTLPSGQVAITPMFTVPEGRLLCSWR